MSSTRTPTAIALPMYAFLSVRGERASEFLQGQLSCDLREAGADRVIGGCCCTPKGRVLASFLLWREDAASIVLRLRRDILADTEAWLRKFGVFSRVAIGATEPELDCIGLLGAAARLHASGLFPRWPEPGAVLAVDGDCRLVARPGTGEMAELWVRASTRDAWLERLGERLHQAPEDAWRHALIESADAEVQAATREAFLPQMLEFDRRGLVSFHKGCYTGQEVVARTHYKGSVKRHLLKLAGDAPSMPAIGAELLLGEASVGRVVECARAIGDGLAVLAVVADDALDRAGEEGLVVEGILLRPCR